MSSHAGNMRFGGAVLGGEAGKFLVDGEGDVEDFFPSLFPLLRLAGSVVAQGVAGGVGGVRVPVRASDPWSMIVRLTPRTCVKVPLLSDELAGVGGVSTPVAAAGNDLILELSPSSRSMISIPFSSLGYSEAVMAFIDSALDENR